MTRDPRLPDDPSSIVFSDINCSFAHLAVHRLHAARCTPPAARRPLPGVDSEVAVVGALDPAAGWRLWQGPDWTYPVTMLPALEAVRAAKRQGHTAAERLDSGLRPAFWAEGRCISMRHTLLDIAHTAGLDTERRADDVDHG